GKAAIFSLFGACDDNAPTAGCPGVAGGNALPTPGNGSFCVPLTDANGHAPEGSGSSCRIAFNWLAGDAYRLRVTAGGPHTWLGSVVDMATGTVTAIGRIRVPDSWQGLASSSVSWIEYYGDQAKLASCRDIPPASARWDAGGGTQLVPGAGLLGAGAISVPAAPTSIHDHVGVGIDLCANSSIVDLPYPALGSVQTMGG
ncbi:MAG: hypothetical protein M3N98_08645, partial [Actinomycetota bacterium]|nr:hypothetical protein [Actinomycetota bacterium]